MLTYLKICFLLLFLQNSIERVIHEPPVGTPAFLRDAVEQISANFRAADIWNANYYNFEEFGTKSLPLRAAVEGIPDKLSSRLPLRDAVEKRPSPDEPFDPILDDFEDIELISQDILAPYRVGNPFQELVTFRQSRRNRNLTENVMFYHGNGNLDEKSDPTRSVPRLVCYVEGSAVYRKSPFDFHASELDPRICTHVIYAFATVDPHQYTLVPQDYDYDVIRGGYLAIAGLKRLNPRLKVLISIGDGREEGIHKYSNMISSAFRRRDFIRSVIRFLDDYGFDGVDLHWQYPGAEELGGRATDKMNFNLLLEELSEIFQSRTWLLSVSVPASRFRIDDGYDVQKIGPLVDFVNLQAFDFHVEKEPAADHHSPLTRREKDNGLNIFFNTDYAVRYWLKRGLNRRKINLGLALHARTFTLRWGNTTSPGAGVRGPAAPGPYTQTPGLLAYFELCDAIQTEGWVKETDDAGSPFAHNGLQWAGYETPDSIRKKVSYMKDVGLGGISVWAVDLDDFRGICGEKNPLLNSVNRALYSGDNSISKHSLGLCPEGDGLYNNPHDCSTYTVCLNNISHQFKCPNNQMYDARIGRCAFLNVERCLPGQMIRVSASALQLKQMTRAAQRHGPKVVCYVTNWAFYRKSDGKFVPEHLDTRLCSHVVFAFASLDPDALVVKESDPWADLDNNLYARVTSAADVPVLLALGGWTDSSGDKYSRLVSDGSARRRFVSSTLSFLRKYNFRGLHFDWNYPVCWQSNCQKGPASDKSNFVKLIQELRVEFDKQTPEMILAAAISGYKEVIDVAYDLKSLGETLDFISVMSYDYHGHWEKKTGHVSPLYHKMGTNYPQYNSNYTMELLVSRGAPREKLLLGLPFYGQSFTLAGGGSRDIGAVATGPGDPGEFTKQPGMLAYYEICHRVKNQKWRSNRDSQKISGPFAFQGNQWVGYDDEETVREKARYITQNGFGGAAAWTVDLDDFNNRCCGGSFPLLKSLNRGLGRLRDYSSLENDCTKPIAPVTPPAPILTTGVDTGASTSLSTTTWPTWSSSTRKPPSSTTTMKTTTMWWQKPSTASSTTTSPWWTTKTTTKTTLTTRKATPTTTTTTTEKALTTASWWQPTPSDMEGRPCDPGSYLPDKTNCNSYFRCILGELRRQNCASGLHWNPERKLCDWPATARCQPSNNKNTKEPIITTTTPRVTTVAITTSTTQTYSETPCVSGQYYPHEKCNLFYICVNGLLVQQNCGPGLHWNVKKNSCDWSFKINCESRNRIHENPSSSIKIQSRNKDCESGAYSSLTGDCSQYMMCLWGKFETFSCASGLHWNNDKHICDWPKNANCGTVSPPGVPPTTTTITTTTATKSPESLEPLAPLSGYFKIVCYFTNWAWYRRGIGKYTPEHIDHNLCTHIVYGFAVLDYENLIIKAHDSWADYDNKFYERVVAYKAKGLTVTLALGGWNDSAGDKYSRLVNNPAARARFIKHVIEFLEKYQFDGLDLDWEYPKCWQVDCKKGPESDKAAFAEFVKELHAAFQPKRLLLSSAVSPSKTVIDAGYDVPALAKYLDWIAIMTYDFHGQWDKKTGHVAPLYYHPDDDVTFFNANFSINYWISEGVPPRKVVMGMPLYGQSFTLETAKNNGLNAKAPGPGQAGEFTRAAGFLAYYEICDRVKNHGWTVVQDPEHRMGPYAYKADQWVSFDDAAMIRQKTKLIRDLNLGGGMVWALDLDDFRNRCGDGAHPLMHAIREGLLTSGGAETITQATTARHSTVNAVTNPIITTVSTTTTTTTVRNPTVVPINKQYKIVCYFTNWAWYRQNGGKYLPTDIDPDLCTHIVYGFAVLNGDQLIIKPHDTWADFDNKFYEKVTALKSKGIKILIAIGGWNDSAGDKYSRLVNNPSARRRFIAHVCDFIAANRFDGLDLDWEYPKCWQVDCQKGPESDKAAFAEFVKELHAAFKPHGWLLSAAVSPAKKVIDAGYNVPVLSQFFDWIAVMCYDYHGQWDKVTGHVAPMYPHPEDSDVTFNTNFTINYWISNGADRRKLVLGMPMYGQSFSLADNTINGLNAPTYGGGEAGDATRARGFLSYYEICERIQKRGWQVVRDAKGRMGPYAYLRDQWVSFDDISMIRHKSEYIKAMGLGGGMIWALDLDDFKNNCGCEKYPLLKTINRILNGYDRTPDPNCQLEVETRITSTTPKYTGKQQPCNGQLYTSDDTDCQKYYLCVQNELISQTCPSGLYWNKNRCDWPENTKCHPDATPTTPEIVTVTEPTIISTPADGNTYKTICYFTNWAWYRPGDAKFKPEDIEGNLCTHVVYGFAVLDSNSLTIKPHDSWADIDNDFYGKVTALRQKGIKVLIAIGGWNDSLGNKYSRLVNNPDFRRKFVEHVVVFIEKWKFDGLDLDWEYPKCWQVDCQKGPESDKAAFAAFVKELHAAFQPKQLLLSSAVSPSKTVIDAGYDVPALAKYLDWIAVMTYDFHGHWDKQTGHVAPLYYYPGDTYDYFNANFSLHYWLEQGAPPKKLIMGVPLYGQSFTLADPSNRGLNSKSYGPGEAGEFTRAGGFLAFYEICDRVKKGSWVVSRDPEGRIGPYAVSGNQWVSYDDVAEVRRKMKLVKQLGLGGGMIWALDLDDFRGRCGCGKHPLLKVLNQELRGGHFNARTNDCT